MIDTNAAHARLFAPKPKAQATRHQALAEAAWKELEPGDQNLRRYLPRYLAVYKSAALAFIDLEELRERAKAKQYPGRWFLQSARIVLGITKAKSEQNKGF
jgi:hypothetical protein